MREQLQRLPRVIPHSFGEVKLSSFPQESRVQLKFKHGKHHLAVTLDTNLPALDNWLEPKGLQCPHLGLQAFVWMSEIEFAYRLVEGIVSLLVKVSLLLTVEGK